MSEQTEQEKTIHYNDAKIWQIAFFSMNNTAANLYLALMGYISYYANSMAGFSVVLISSLVTAMNIFDGVTDPVVGFLLDKGKGRFGKFRPFMVAGNILMAVSAVLLFATTHLISKWVRIPYFIIIYAIFIIGYTFQTVVAKSGQTIITNNPKKRPLSTYFDSIFIMAAYGGSALFVANYLVPKYGGFTNEELYVEYVFWVVVLSALATLLAVIGIWKKDQPGRYEHQQTQKIKVWDFFLILANPYADYGSLHQPVCGNGIQPYNSRRYALWHHDGKLWNRRMDWCGGSVADAFGSDRWHPGGAADGTEEGTGIIYGTWHFLPVTIDCGIDAG